MKFRYKAIVLSGVVLLLAATYLLGTFFGSRQKSERGSALPLLAIESASDIGRIEIFTSEGRYDLDRIGDGWNVDRDGFSFPAETGKVVAFAETLAALPRGRLAAAKQEFWTNFGVDGTTGVSVYDATDKLIGTLYIGNPDSTGEHSYLRVEGDSKTWISEALDYQVRRSAKEWGNLQVVKGEGLGSVIAFTVKGRNPFAEDGGEGMPLDYTIRKDAQSGQWELEGRAGVSLDQQALDSLANQLKTVKASEYSAETDAGILGFSTPAVAITVYLSGGTTFTLDVGNSTNEAQSFFLNSSLDDHVYVLSKWTLERIVQEESGFILDEAASSDG